MAEPHVDPEALAEQLLRAPPVTPVTQRWAYSPVGMAVASLYVLYHCIALLQHTTPYGGLKAEFHQQLEQRLRVSMYMRATSSLQSWSMFAPNPHRANTFLRVYVELEDGQVFDLMHDMYGRRSYPYLVYDRMGKINRRLLEQERYRQPYAAWVCRSWATEHGGEVPVRVMFEKLWTRVPHPSEAIPQWGFDPLALPVTRETLPSIRCATTPHGQVPAEVRERHGLPPLKPGEFRDISVTTWWQKVEQSRQATSEAEAGNEDGGDG